MQDRAREREAFSINLWKKINPGYMSSAAEISQYSDEHSFAAEDLKLAKGEAKQWEHHLCKTDITKYVEAAARAKVVSKIPGGKKK
mmetsp:Transcript_26091/g.41887  ORF Transcript_26091/g.41887 Transcript_26091/m.41887 type:complete len:86 (-) Transcript_26091:53-310(-)